MRNRTAIKWARNPLLAVLLLVAFCAHALIPAGFMPGPGGLTICYGHRASTRVSTPQAAAHETPQMAGMDMAGMSKSHSTAHSSGGAGAPEHQGSAPCPFAAAATSMAICILVVLIFSFALVHQQIPLPAEPVFRRGTIVPTRLPRGPPAIV